MGNTNSLKEDTARKVKYNGQEALNSARENASDLAEKAKEGAESVGDRVGEFAENVRESLPESVGEAKDAVVDGFRTSRDYLRTHDMNEMSSDLTELARNHPLMTIGIGAGLGFALGRIFTSSTSK